MHVFIIKLAGKLVQNSKKPISDCVIPSASTTLQHVHESIWNSSTLTLSLFQKYLSLRKMADLTQYFELFLRDKRLDERANWKLFSSKFNDQRQCFDAFMMY